MDPAWAVAAFGAGLGAAALAMQVALPRLAAPAPAARLTASWRLDELDRPTIVCRELAWADAVVPAGSRVLCSGAVARDVLRHATVRRVADVPAEFALAADGGRALLFPGGLRPGAWAWPVSDEATLQRLRSQVDALEAAAVPYAERRSVADLAGDPGLPVEAEGTVRDVVPRAGGHLLRLEDGGHVAAVRVSSVPEGLAGRRVSVRGRLGRDASGYAVVEADEVRPL